MHVVRRGNTIRVVLRNWIGLELQETKFHDKLEAYTTW